ncbi:unnamed protein product [Moneuplotes crassus]|uniref:Uncharacterized protein n=1 Tax=Euplotes crassus TaxID=5936 RepID=A0AAD2D917_EUPCR|nr:unnamed protein product [Moneuplotes crassus]
MIAPKKTNKEEDLSPDEDILNIMKVKQKMESAIKINSFEVNQNKWAEIILGVNLSTKKLEKIPSTMLKPAFTFCEKKIHLGKKKNPPKSESTVVSMPKSTEATEVFRMPGGHFTSNLAKYSK